jgi:hypothetical protein
VAITVIGEGGGTRIITIAHRTNEGQMPKVRGKNAQSNYYFIDRAEPDQIAGTLVETVIPTGAELAS